MSDPTFPVVHGRPARGWINDPNGLSRFGDRYHVFFQHNPDAPVHGSIGWGHISSTDLLTWRQEPVALRPRTGEVDAAGCWSGCVVDDDGAPTAIYTAVPDEASDAWATLARGTSDLRDWTAGPAVTGGPDDPAVEEVRDPFAFRHAGHRYVVQGGGRPATDGDPVLLVYQADDLENWVPLGPLLEHDDPVAAKFAPANIWECPNLFRLDGRWVLVLSLWRARGYRQGELTGVRYLLGDLDDRQGLMFVPESAGEIDLGPAFYAPQVLPDGDRVLLWGWSWELDRSAEQIAAAGWAGALTFPRELRIVEDQLVSRPAAELTGLRSGPIDVSSSITEYAFELVADRPIGLDLVIDGQDQLVVDPAIFGGGSARILIDGSLVEAYGDTHSFTTRAYPTAHSIWSAHGAVEGYRLSAAPRR